MNYQKIFGFLAGKKQVSSTEKTQNKAFVSLKNRNFRLLWIGGVLSHIGDDMQIVAVSWLVLMLTNSPFLMGIAGLAQGIPRLFFGFIGGVIADRGPSSASDDLSGERDAAHLLFRLSGAVRQGSILAHSGIAAHLWVFKGRIYNLPSGLRF